MKRTTSAVLGLLVCGLLVYPALGSAQNFDNVQIRTLQVTESIYVLQGSGGNIGVSIGDDGTFIVDDQFAPLTDKIVAAIAELTDHAVDFVVISTARAGKFGRYIADVFYLPGESDPEVVLRKGVFLNREILILAM